MHPLEMHRRALPILASPSQSLPCLPLPDPPLPSHANFGNNIIKGGNMEHKFVKIKAGKFTMGSPELEKLKYDDEDQVQVEISQDFEIMNHPVTQRHWYSVMGYNPSWFKGEARPVERVAWFDVRVFIQKINKKTGKNHRLPTEAEWEYACRAGTDTRFFWGNDEEDIRKYAVIDQTQTAPVMSKKPNSWGLYDMCGNVWEWVQDFYQKKLPGGKDPLQESGDSEMVTRGASWHDIFPKNLRPSIRGRNRPWDRSNDLGFRLVRIIK